MQLAHTRYWLVEHAQLGAGGWTQALQQKERTITAVINIHNGLTLRSTYTNSQVW
jgi:hypothetical protein